MIKFLDLPGQYQQIKPEIDQAVEAAITQGAFVGGAAVKQFEASFAAYQGASHCIGVGNGTDAIEIAIEALSLPKGSEIIVPANSFIASSEAVTRSGHKVVFADIEPDTYLLDVEDVARRITPSTAAIMAVHLYGQPAAMDKLEQIADDHDLVIIEDCAQAHGAEFEGRRVGSIGVVGTFSFYPGKNLGAYGDAGAIVTNSSLIAKQCRMIANHGRVDKYFHEFEGRNSRLDALQAAVLSVKLTHLDHWIERRNRVAKIYTHELSTVESVKVPRVVNNVRHVFHLYVIQAQDRDYLRSYLAEENIQSGIHYPVALPMLEAYAYLDRGSESMIASERSKFLLSLPIGEHISDEEAHHVSSVVRAFYEK
jgi:dTDP-4-amino-4,6-dideoxygalactose transaminase